MRLSLVTKSPLSFGEHDAANFVRGQFGRMLHEGQPELYQRLFAPVTAGGPSGLKDPPRPYVVRTRELAGRQFRAGEQVPFTVHLFGVDWPGSERVVLELKPVAEAVTRVRVEYLTPTELKGGKGAEFGVLFARLRDRVSSLRQLYGEGALPIAFREMGERAQAVKTTRCELVEVDRVRTSRATGQRHPIGGFVGVAEYEGELSEFVPYLEAGWWTGVGRQTVWGKGEIRTTRLG